MQLICVLASSICHCGPAHATRSAVPTEPPNMASKNSASSSSEDAKAELAALLKRKNEVEVRNLLYSAETLTVSTFYFPHGLVCIAMNGARRWGGGGHSNRSAFFPLSPSK